MSALGTLLGVEDLPRLVVHEIVHVVQVSLKAAHILLELLAVLREVLEELLLLVKYIGVVVYLVGQCVQGVDDAGVYLFLRLTLGVETLQEAVKERYLPPVLFYRLALSRYSPVRVSTTITSPTSTNMGTVNANPVSRVAGLPLPDTVSPL